MRALVITSSITSRDQRSLDKYFNDINHYDVLTPDEEVQLFKDYKNGDEAAYERLILCNLRFVVSVAKKYQHLGIHLGDLINEGNIGLIKAAQRFDISRGFKFISYAVWWIRQSIIQALNERSRKIRLPVNQSAKAKKIHQTRLEMLQKMEREPTDLELAEHSEMTESEVTSCMSSYVKCGSLDAPVSDDSAASLGDLMENEQTEAPDHQLVSHESMKTDVMRLLSTLPEKESAILSQYYGVAGQRQHSLQDISDNVGLSRERIRQIIQRSLSKLRTRESHLEFSMN